MAESMKGLKRSHRCAELSNADIGKEVTLMGWVQKRRNLGSLVFVDLRDRTGLIQLYFEEEIIGKEGFDKAGSLRAEYVIAVTGQVLREMVSLTRASRPATSRSRFTAYASYPNPKCRLSR